VREQLKELTKQYDKSENDLKALQSVGQVTIDICNVLHGSVLGFVLLIIHYLSFVSFSELLPLCI